MKSISKEEKKIDKGPQKDEHVNQYGSYSGDSSKENSGTINKRSEEE